MPSEEIRAKRRKVQEIIGVEQDEKIGPKTRAAFEALFHNAPEKPAGGHVGKASSFADPADIRAFKKCKATGKSDQECFKVGDNGIGKWGDDTTVDRPMCALPPDDWKALGNPRGAKVLVNIGGQTVVCELRDTMPAKKNIKNGAIIDLNPAAVKAFGLKPPIMVNCAWSWV